MSTALYVEINLLCMFSMIVLARTVHKVSLGTAQDRLLKLFLSLIATVLLLDAITILCDGASFSGARWISIAANTAVFACNGIIAVVWLLFVDYSAYCDENRLRRRLPAYLMPAGVVVVMAVLSQPFHLVFYVDENTVYHRSDLFWVQAAITVLYLFAALFIALRKARTEQRRGIRRDYIILAAFAIFPFVGGVAQGLVYGLPMQWPFTTCAMLLVVTNLQNRHIFTDALTGLSNRARLDQFLAAQVREHNLRTGLYMILIDVDYFKAINDTFGHAAGDAALNRVAACLQRAVIGANDVVARYGGDEFAVVCRRRTEAEVRLLQEIIQHEIDVDNQRAKAGSPILSLSMGYSRFAESGEENAVEKFFCRADANMYEMKKKRHAMSVPANGSVPVHEDWRRSL